MSATRLGAVLIVLALAAPSGASAIHARPGGTTCSTPRVDPKTGDVVTESEKQAVADHGKDAPHGCAPAGGPKPEVPTQPTPAPEPEKPAVAAKPSDPPHRDQPIGGEKPEAKNDTASTDKKPTDKPSV